MPTLVYVISTCKGLWGPYRAISVKPATIVGNANGRSITELTALFPKKLSRTSTQAMMVPQTLLMTTTTAERPTVSSRAEVTDGMLIALQNVDQPPPAAFHM